MQILIYSGQDDVHSGIVSHVMRGRGHRVVELDQTFFSAERTFSLSFSDNEAAARLFTREEAASLLCEFDVVWNRRPSQPVPAQCVHAKDASFVARELKSAAVSIADFMDSAFWVNPRLAASTAELKPVQLREACRAGLSIPNTLISNNPAEIRSFLRSHRKVIYKPLNGHVWREDGTEYGSYTACVTEHELPNDRLLQAAPGIFQAQVDKLFEVRAQFFGATCLAVQIESHKIPYGDIDWRLHQRPEMAAGAIQVPGDIYAKSRTLMSRLGLVTGAFDFIIRPTGEWVFLEVNQAGQFLFLERWCQDLPVLDAFVGFIESRDPEYRYKNSPLHLRYNDVFTEYQRSKRSAQGLIQARSAAEARV
jgi:hypothetical protein